MVFACLQFIVTGAIGLGAARTNINHRQSGLVGLRIKFEHS